MRPLPVLWLAAMAILLAPTPAGGAVILESEAEQAQAIAAQPGAGVPVVQSFESLPIGTVLGAQLAGFGIHFTSVAPTVILPEAFGTPGIDTRLAVTGFGPQTGATLTLAFDEPQLTISAWFVDVGQPLLVTALEEGVTVEQFVLPASGEGLAGGLFRGLWFVGPVDTLVLAGAAAEDGFGLDELAVAAYGTVDGDGDGFTDLDGDCDDTDPTVFPGAFDGCDGLDNDCDGSVDEDADGDGDGTSACDGDCDDTDPAISPTAAEVCDGIDNDCDGAVDELPDMDGDGFGPCDGDCLEGFATVFPGAPEICDGLDNDCDGFVDDTGDVDGDGFSVCDGDCDDLDPNVFPGQGCGGAGDDDDSAGDDDDSAGDDDDSAVGDDDDSVGDDDDSVGDDDDSAAGDDDDSAAGDDDDSAAGDDDDSAVGDDDDSAVGDDDDSAVGDDDDSAVGDDDDSAGDDDDSAGDDDDSAGDDDDSASAGPVRGIAGGGCDAGCDAAQVDARAGPLLLLLGLTLLGLRRQRRGVGLLIVMLLLLPAPLFAQSGSAAEVPESTLGLDTLRFRPAATSSGGVLAEGVHPGAPWGFDAALWLTYARNEIVFTEDGELTGEPVLGHRLAGVLRLGVTLGTRVRIALDLPAAFAQNGVHPTDGTGLAVGGLGDLTLTPHVMILDPAKMFLGVGLSAPVTFPTGRVDALLGDPLPTVQPRVSLEKRLDWPKVPLLNLTATVHLGARVRGRTELLDLDSGTEFVFGTALRWDPISQVGIASEVVGAIGSGSNARRAEWLSSVRVIPDRKGRFVISGGAGFGLGRGVGTPEGRLFASVELRLPLRREPSPAIAVVETPPMRAPEPLPDPGPPIESAQAGWGLRLVDRMPRVDHKVLFEFDSAQLLRDARPALDALADWVLSHPTGALEIIGHADPLGSAPYNVALSEARAKAVLAYLQRAGVPGELMSARGRGETEPGRPSADPDPRVAWSASRRVEFRWSPPDSLTSRTAPESSSRRRRR